ncbi:hypothetical protein B0A48_05902 [Cryoendolithus antarcticus]|uniref:Protein kinase domain-containing protein n=1 Tax=Cryoendolithus antarcticus TaxID=1507870 RepID=A0A1V8TCN2_9PEZI|nr:hypothetical protein B0A48_05902 [Cryoendolithus antarcticus]
MPVRGTAPFATFLIIGPTCFFLGILFALFPYDYHVLWTSPIAALGADPSLDPRAPFFDLQEAHLKFLHASPPLISRILHIVIGTGLLGFLMKLYKPSEANMLFDGASLALYMCGIAVYIANLVKGMRTVTAGAYGGKVLPKGESFVAKVADGVDADFIGREDSLRVLAASDTILALVLVGVLILQAGQWYAQRKEAEEIAAMDKAREERKAAGKEGKKTKTPAEYALQEHKTKLATSYQSLLSDFSSLDLTTVGNYSLGRLIGKGSFGRVYLASHKLTNGSKVVLKSAKKDDANLAREIHHHRQFLHPHIARLYEVIVTETLVWLVLEWCPGDELYNHLLKHGRMEAAKVQRIFTQLVGAVSYVHAKACVHRDLKLENILLDKNGNVKLVDFGFTREYQGSTSYLQTWCGTVCYSAPEMLRGEKYAGEKVDVWSLGIILYALICGELPFDEEDESETKRRILAEEPVYPEYMPEAARDLIKKLLSKRPILRPSLGDILKDPWLTDHSPQQHEILKLQQPAPFSTQLEKDTLQRMRSAGVDIDTVIENVLSQRCDALAGWWALLIEKEQRKERRKERKRKDREAETKSLRRLSAASSRLLAQSALLGEIHEGDEIALGASPQARGRRMSRRNGSLHRHSQLLELPKVPELKAPSPEAERDKRLPLPKLLPDDRDPSRSRSRPAPPPKDPNTPAVRRARTVSRSSTSMLRNVTVNPDLLSPSYVPPPQRRKNFYQQPLKRQLQMFKHWFKEGAKRTKSPNSQGSDKSKGRDSPEIQMNGVHVAEQGSLARKDITRSATTLTIPRKAIGDKGRPELLQRQTLPARPRLYTDASAESRNSIIRKRQSLSPHTLTPHSSYRRSSVGLRGRTSTSSSVSSVRSAYPSAPAHGHSLSKASSTSSNSVASPSGLSATSASRMARSPHGSVKVLPATPASTVFPSGIRVSRRPPPSTLGTLQGFPQAAAALGGEGFGPSSPGLPIFARRKRSVFKGPMAGNSASPSGFGRVPMGASSRSGSVPGRRSGEMIGGIQEEEEDEDDEFDPGPGLQSALPLDEDDEDDGDEKWEEMDQFGPELGSPGMGSPGLGSPGLLSEEAESPISPPEEDTLVEPNVNGRRSAASAHSIPLTAEALAKKDAADLDDAAQGVAVPLI